MATVSYDVSTAFLTRMRAAMVAESPALQGQTNAVINEAARVRARQLIRNWVVAYEEGVARAAVPGTIQQPTDADIL